MMGILYISQSKIDWNFFVSDLKSGVEKEQI